MKKITSVLCAITLVFLLFIPAAATANSTEYVFDFASVLTDSEVDELNRRAIEFANEHNESVCLVTQDENESIGGSYSYIYETYPEVFSGCTGTVILSIDFNKSEYQFYPYGDAETVYTQELYRKLDDTVSKYSAIDDYYLLFTTLLGQLDDFLNGGSGSEFGSNYDYSAPESNGKLIVDFAELLTDTQEAELLAKIENIRTTYNVDVILHSTDDLGGKSIVNYCDDFFAYNDYGLGENKDGISFTLSMAGGEGNRDYYFCTHGYCITAFTDYGIDILKETVLPYLQSGDYYDAYSVFLDTAVTFLEQSKTDKPFDINNQYSVPKTASDYITSEVILIVIAVVIAFIAVNMMKGKMKNAFQKAEASEYVVPGSMNVTGGNDVFLYKNVTRAAKPKETSSSGSGGGSSTHSSSSGGSFGGGGGKF